MRILVLSIFLLGAPAARGASVLSHTPGAEGFADAGAPVILQFSETMDPSSLDQHELRIFGRWSGPIEFTIAWSDADRRLEIVPSSPFAAGETVTVRLARDLLDGSGQPLANGYAFQFWVRSAPAGLEFETARTVEIRRPAEALVRAYGANAADLNGDGFSDLAVPCESASDLRIFLNDGEGGYDEFEIMPLIPGGGPSANEAADFDRDGQVDLILGNAFSDRAMLLRGRGDGSFDPLVPHVTSRGVRAVAVLDLDGDACEDVVTANREGNEFHVLLGDGAGNLSTPQALDSGLSGETALAVGECNGDGLLDLFLGCNEGERLLVYLNDGRGGLVQSASVAAGGRPWVVVSGDLNGDGHADVASCNSYADNLSVAFGDGEGGLSPVVVYRTGAFPLAIDLGDLDGDGDLDVMTSNYLAASWTLYENDGDGNFTNRQDIPAQRAGSCAIFHDRDGDGILDFTGVDELADLLFLFQRRTLPIPPAQLLRVLSVGPNPFPDSASIDYETSFDASVELQVFDLRGRLIRSVRTPERAAGAHRVVWDGRDAQGEVAPSGVYRLRLRSGGFERSLPITLLR